MRARYTKILTDSLLLLAIILPAESEELEPLDLLQRLSLAEGLELSPFAAAEASAAAGAVAGRRS